MPSYYLEIAVVALGLFLLLAEAFMGKTDRRALAWIAVTGLSGIFVATFFATGAADAIPEPGTFWSYYTADKLAIFYKAIAIATTALVIFMAADYTPVLEEYTAKTGHGGGLGEFYCLPVFVCAGLMWMASATDLTSIFVALETVTISFYILVAYLRRNLGSLEAGVKYLILGALSTGFLVYGMTWLFGLTGQTNLGQIGQTLQSLGADQKPAILFSLALLLVGLGFKIAAVPFQIWVPDVYQGAPTPVTAFLSVGSKAAGFIILTRILEPYLATAAIRDSVIAILVIIAAATLVYGNLAAIPQTNFKRLLAYSSISHAGFLVLALACASPDKFDIAPATVVAFYMATYLLMTMLCFIVLTVVRKADSSEEIDAFNGLHKRSPFLAFALLIGVISLAGVPLTAGFLGKFFVFNLAVDQGHWVALAFAVLGAAAGFYYYLKVARSMYWNDVPDNARAITLSPSIRFTLIALVVAIIIFGVYPAPLLNLLP
ncbi:MAG: NADH-quinone oxidoreductase subunit N [Verrucomicrobiales bacterium]|nr:NADH-quinone oxidoreductase subunit N [Verrucomicrobiales bacterium]